MPTIEITEEQHGRLEDVRTGLEEHRVGPYGIARTVDAVEFLLDQYEADVDSISETPEPDRDGVGRWNGGGEAGAETGDTGDETRAATEDGGSDPENAAGGERDGSGPGAGDEDDLMEDSGDEDDLIEGSGDEQEGAVSGTGGKQGVATADAGGEHEGAVAGEQAGVAGDEPGEATEGDEAQDDTDDESSEDRGETGGGGYEGSESGRLDAMMRLLDEHDEKWQKSGAEGGRYIVTLPDGSQEGVRTKDDVRALLFKHY